MSHPPHFRQRILADHIQVGSDGRSDVYPALFLYGCGCWSLAILAAILVWLLW